MKYRLITVLLATLWMSGSLWAQTEKGAWVVGGNASMNVGYAKDKVNQPSGKSDNIVLGIIPEVGYFVFDNISAGLSGSYRSSLNTIADDEITLLAQVKYYFSQSACRPFAKANVGFQASTVFDDTGTYLNSKSVNGLAFGGGVGCAFFIRERISIDLGLHYLHSNLKQTGNTYDLDSDQYYDFTVRKNEINVFIGFSFYL